MITYLITLSLEREIIVLEKSGKSLEFWIQKSVRSLLKGYRYALSPNCCCNFSYAIGEENLFNNHCMLSLVISPLLQACSLRAGGQGFSAASMNVTPAYFNRKMEEK